MPKSLVLGNGTLLVCFDANGQVHDFYYPYVGQENHSGTYAHKIGVWVDGSFSWVSRDEWDITIDYKEDTLVSHIVAKNFSKNIELYFEDFVYNEQSIFVRNIRIKNTSNNAREFRIFFNQQFQISELKHGNTAYFDPDIDAIIHYRGRRVFLVSGTCDGSPINNYSIGLSQIEGHDGTWKDAEDGSLSGNAVEHGNVDSTISFHKRIEPNKESSINYWIIAAEEIPVAKGLNRFVKIKTVDHISESTEDYWRAWVNKLDFDFVDLDEKAVTLFKKSLLIMRTHIDEHGAIIASGDSDILQAGRDTYSYMWPRDAAIAAIALDKAGYFEVTNRFFTFCNDVLSEQGYLLHKYRPDRSLGSSWHPWVHKNKRQLAIQEDETAVVLHALWIHYTLHKNLEFVEGIYNSFIKKTADFLYFYRDDKNNLPYGSYDLWEEKFGTTTYTASAVYAALTAASNFAHVLGKEEDSKKYYGAARSVRDAIMRYLYDDESGFFYKLVDLRYKDIRSDKTVDISSFYGPFRFGVLSPDDVRLKHAHETLQNTLCCNASVGKTGGAIRYVGDTYHQIDPNVPGNPWFITTLWLYQFKISQAKTFEDLGKVKEDLDWICERALKSGLLSEQLNPNTGEQISVSPLTWSHAEFILTIFDYIERYNEIQAKKQ
tara:strand:+ start:6944 stop:8917 length:1974 start_codon:yes stop_codon:yes gene_type:complete